MFCLCVCVGDLFLVNVFLFMIILFCMFWMIIVVCDGLMVKDGFVVVGVELCCMKGFSWVLVIIFIV